MSGYTRGYSLAKIGALAVMAGSLFLTAFAWMTGRTLTGNSSDLYVRVSTAEGLKNGDAVLLRGVQVGEVKNLAFGQNAVVIRARLRQDLPLTDAWTAALVAADMFGRQSLVLRPAAGGRPIAHGDTLAGTPAASLTEKIAGLGESASRIVSDTTAELLHSALIGLSQAAVQLAALAGSGRAAIEMSTIRVDSIARNLQAATTPAALAPITDNLTAMSARLDSTSLALNQAMLRLQQPDGTVGRLLNEDSLYIRINGALASLETLLTDVRQNPKRYINVRIF